MGERLVVIGADGAGMAAASQARRRRQDLDVVALEKGRWTSYSACGIPYLVGGAVGGLDDLVARTPEQFRVMGIDVRTEHEVLGIDLDARQIVVHHTGRDRTFKLGFDLLHIATGAVPHRPPIPGIGLAHVHGVQTLADAESLLDDLKAHPPKQVVVVGSGYVGLELAEAFMTRGVSVTVVDHSPEVMGKLDPDMGALVSRAMRADGISVRLEESVLGIEEGAVHTSAGELRADVVILGLGVEPNSELAAKAGVATGVRGAIVVDRQQRTSAPGVWAAGDCCQSRHLVSGQPVYVALGTVANKQGRVAGINIGGGYATFPGVVGTAVTRFCHVEIALTGLSTLEATAAGFEYVTAKIDATSIAGYMPGSAPITVKMLAERGSGRVLGAQIVGAEGAAKRADVVATALAARMTVEDVVNLDLGYAPPFSSVWDPVQVAARQALTLLA